MQNYSLNNTENVGISIFDNSTSFLGDNNMLFNSDSNVAVVSSNIIIKGTASTNDTKTILHDINNNPSFINMTAAEVCSKVETEANLSGEILIMMLLLFFSIFGANLLKKYKIRIIGESLFATLIGLIAGFILNMLNNTRQIHNITIGYVKFFLIILLPPIIFESGYNLKKKIFFKNFGTILTFAILGTLTSILSIAIIVYLLSLIGLLNFSFKQSIGFGSLISATDAVAIISAFKEVNVDPNFFQLLFGESCLNDAVSIVFYETTIKFNEKEGIFYSLFIAFLDFSAILIGSILVGLFIGFVTAWSFKKLSEKSKQLEKIEIGCMTILPFVSYLTAEMLGFSGIVAILFNGIAHSTYTKPYLRAFSRIAIKGIYEMVAHLFETLAYIFLGLGFSSFSSLFKYISIGSVTLLSIIVFLARAINIILCSYLCNKSRTDNKLNQNKQFMLWFAGTRGAMAFALALKSKIDFPEAGKQFLPFTLCFASLTLIITDFSLNYVIRKLNIIVHKRPSSNNLRSSIDENKDRPKIEISINTSNFDKASKFTVRENYSDFNTEINNDINNEKSNQVKTANNKLIDSNKRSLNNKSSSKSNNSIDKVNTQSFLFCFIKLKQNAYKFHKAYLIPMVERNYNKDISLKDHDIQMALFDKEGNILNADSKDSSSNDNSKNNSPTKFTKTEESELDKKNKLVDTS